MEFKRRQISGSCPAAAPLFNAVIVLALLLSGTVSPVFSAEDTLGAPAVRSARGGLADRVVEHRLSNGLQLLLVERRQVPIVSCMIAYKVGGVNERPGNTGVAHFFEHLAFKGTRSLGTKDFRREFVLLQRMDRAWSNLRKEQEKGAKADPARLAAHRKRLEDLERESEKYIVPNEIGEIYEQNGAVGLNATTGKDMTRYVVSLPANRLELWAAIESDRMSHAVLREFYKEKNVVLEERRLRYENSPSGRLYETFLSAAFTAHPYGMPVIGWTSDLEALSRSQTETFFKTHYGPGNAVIVIVGDISIPETIRLVEKYFGLIPTQPPPPLVVTVEPEPAGERRAEVEFEAEPSVLIGYHRPALDHPDDAVFDVIDSLMSGGRSSRLYKTLVKEKQLAVNISTAAGVPGARYPHLFMIQATPRAPHRPGELETAIYAELDRLKNEPVPPRELQKVLNNLDAGLIRSLDSNSGLASQLSYFQTVAGTWRYLLDNRERIGRVTAEDVARVARTYFVKSNRVVATLVKKGNE
ncbi:MAG: insulinase family protein [Nitrospirae bacterium]|nr:insulinase family protein [Nitrospirota bacterium]